MDARQQIEELLRENAKLIRQGNHLVYRLPNGKNFIMAKSPSDYRYDKNALSVLRKELGLITPTRPSANEQLKKMVPELSDLVAPQKQECTSPPVASAIDSAIAKQIAAETARMEWLLTEAAKVEKNIALLEAVQAFANEPETESTLRIILGENSQIVVPDTGSHARTDPVTERVHVTTELVVAAVNTFERPFSLNDVLFLMMGDKYDEIAQDERRRIRSSLIGILKKLCDQGSVHQTVPGLGKKPAFYELVSLNHKVE